MTLNQTALAEAVEAAGGQLALATKIGTSQSNVWEWLRRSKRGVPAEWVLAVEGASGVSRHALRPDIYGEAAAQAAG